MFFLKLNDKIYKTQDEITISDGLPFANLHLGGAGGKGFLRIKSHKNRFLISYQNLKQPIRVNSKTIPPLKWASVDITSSISLGDMQIQLMDSYEGEDFEEVLQFTSVSESRPGIFLRRLVLIMLLLSPIIWDQLGTGSFTPLLVFLWGGMSLFMSASMMLVNNFIRGRIFVDKIVAGTRGLALYCNNQVTSISYAELTSIEQKQKDYLSVNTESGRYVFLGPQNDKLYHFIQKRSSSKAKKKGAKKNSLLTTLIAVVLGVAMLSILLMVDERYSLELILAIGGFILAVINLAAKPLLKVRNQMNEKTAVLYHWLVTGGMIYLSFSSYIVFQKQRAIIPHIDQCLASEGTACEKIPLDYFDDKLFFEARGKEELQQKLCLNDDRFC